MKSMSCGLTTAQWHSLTEGWTPAMRAYGLDLLVWLWEHPYPLPKATRTLQRLARADRAKDFEKAWQALRTSGAFVESEHGHYCPLLDTAKAHREAKARAGRAGAEARRQPAKMSLPSVEAPVRTPAQHMLGSPPQQEPVDNLWKTGGKPVESAGSAVEIGPPQTPPLSGVLGTKILDPDQDHGTPAAGAALSSRPVEIARPTLDGIALHVAAFVLTEARGELSWDDFRDRATACIEQLYAIPRTAPAGIDQTELTYRVWDDGFLGGYRDRFVTDRKGIRLA